MSDDSRLTPSEKSQISFEELRLKQSVRTTFKLPKETISLLGLIAGQLGIKQKSLLDQLTEDKKSLERLAEEADTVSGDGESRYPKTFVISRSTLQSINEIAKRQKIPRDILVEFSIRRLVPVIETEREKHTQRKKIFEEMSDYLIQGEKLLKRAKEMLGENDEIYRMIKKQVILTKKNITKSGAIIERGSPMEDW